MVIRGGENIYPTEVEAVLRAHPTVADAGVVGVPDDRLGETLAAFVVPADNAVPPERHEAQAYVRTQLAGFKVPAYVYLVNSLPLNAAGKLMRAPLRQWHVAHLT